VGNAAISGTGAPDDGAGGAEETEVTGGEESKRRAATHDGACRPDGDGAMGNGQGEGG